MSDESVRAPGPSLPGGFDASLAQFAKIGGFLSGGAAADLEHYELEAYIKAEGFELLRLLLQDHFDLRAMSEARLEEVTDTRGHAHRAVEGDHERRLATIVGTVRVSRMAYRRRGQQNLYPADAILNLPAGLHSHGVRELAAVESSRGSFEEAKEAIRRSSGVNVGHRQVEELAVATAVDFAAFYDHQPRPTASETEVVIVSADGKGVAMRPEDLRPATAKAQAEATPKLRTRRSKGEKPCKRMAEVAAVYVVEPVARSAAEVLASHGEPDTTKQAPKAKDKWLTASVVEDAATVIAEAFSEADRRDPEHSRTWVALVDGNNHQISRIKAEAKKRKVKVTIVVDLIHVMTYLWDAAWCFFAVFSSPERVAGCHEFRACGPLRIQLARIPSSSCPNVPWPAGPAIMWPIGRSVWRCQTGGRIGRWLTTSTAWWRSPMSFSSTCASAVTVQSRPRGCTPANWRSSWTGVAAAGAAWRTAPVI